MKCWPENRKFFSLLLDPTYFEPNDYRMQMLGYPSRFNEAGASCHSSTILPTDLIRFDGCRLGFLLGLSLFVFSSSVLIYLLLTSQLKLFITTNTHKTVRLQLLNLFPFALSEFSKHNYSLLLLFCPFQVKIFSQRSQGSLCKSRR